MSQYKRIETQFKNLESLKKALQDVLGDTFELDASLQNSLKMYDWHDQLRPERCTVRVDRKNVNHKWSSGASNDFGLSYDQGTKMFTAIISDYDTRAGTMNLLNQLKQRYAYHEVIRQAKLKGYAVRPVQSQDKTIRLQLVKL